MGDERLTSVGSPFRVMDKFWRWRLHNIVNGLNATELFTSKCLILRHMNFNSIKILNNKKVGQLLILRTN